MANSLYRAWQERVAEYPDRTALTDATSGETLTFSELDATATTACQFPQGMTATFIRQTLASWREGIPTCPLETGTPEPDLSGLPDRIAHVKITSGSTGAPRFIVFTADQLAADAHNIVATMELSPELPNIGVISMAHSYGFSNLVLPLLLHGVPLILGGDPLPGSFQRALTFLPKTGGTVPAVPAMWRAWFKAGCLSAEKIKVAISAGAPLTAELERAIFEEAGIKVHNFYGSSECGGIAYDRSETPRADPDTVGTPLEGVRTEISSHGCLSVRGDAVGSDYWPTPDPSVLSDSCFSTSDLAQIDSDDSIQLLGRAGDLINIAGRKLDPSSIENELIQHPEIDHCVVFGVPSSDPERVQEIVAITNAGDLADLRGHLARRLPAWQKVSHWWVTADLKPNARGKISRSEWHQTWQDATANGDSASS